MIFFNNYIEAMSELDAFYSAFKEKAEDCYLRWLNADPDLTDAEVKLALDYQAMTGNDADTVEIEIPPEQEISPEELQALLRIAKKLNTQGLGSLLSLLAGANFTNDTTYEELASSKLSNDTEMTASKFTIDNRIF